MADDPQPGIPLALDFDVLMQRIRSDAVRIADLEVANGQLLAALRRLTPKVEPPAVDPPPVDPPAPVPPIRNRAARRARPAGSARQARSAG